MKIKNTLIFLFFIICTSFQSVLACGFGCDDEPNSDRKDTLKIQTSEAITLDLILNGMVGCFTQPSLVVRQVQACLGLTNNFYEVDPGKLYRSAQLSVEELEDYVKQYGIKTVINLRGRDPSQKWWVEENAWLQKHTIAYFNIPMDAHTLTTKEHLFELLNIYDRAELPILVHCRVGADRTGEAVALWALEKQKKTKQEALEHLDPTYGHSKIMHPAKRFLVEIWQGRVWLEKEYEPAHYAVKKLSRSGTPEELLKYAEIDAESIVKTVLSK